MGLLDERNLRKLFIRGNKKGMKKENLVDKTITEKIQYYANIKYTKEIITIKYNQYENQIDFYNELLKLVNKINLECVIIGPTIHISNEEDNKK